MKLNELLAFLDVEQPIIVNVEGKYPKCAFIGFAKDLAGDTDKYGIDKISSSNSVLELWTHEIR